MEMSKRRTQQYDIRQAGGNLESIHQKHERKHESLANSSTDEYCIPQSSVYVPHRLFTFWDHSNININEQL